MLLCPDRQAGRQAGVRDCSARTAPQAHTAQPRCTLPAIATGGAGAVASPCPLAPSLTCHPLGPTRPAAAACPARRWAAPPPQLAAPRPRPRPLLRPLPLRPPPLPQPQGWQQGPLLAPVRPPRPRHLRLQGPQPRPQQVQPRRWVRRPLQADQGGLGCPGHRPPFGHSRTHEAAQLPRRSEGKI